jgi:phospholipid/cholesterol/gamma-HCH transport system substrate-binding protein
MDNLKKAGGNVEGFVTTDNVAGGDENKSAEAPAESDVTPPAGTTNSSQEK